MDPNQRPTKIEAWQPILYSAQNAIQAIANILNTTLNPSVASMAAMYAENMRRELDMLNHVQQTNLLNQRGPVREAYELLLGAANRACPDVNNPTTLNKDLFDVIHRLEMKIHDKTLADYSRLIFKYWPHSGIGESYRDIVLEASLNAPDRQTYQDAKIKNASLQKRSPNGHTLIVDQINPENNAHVSIQWSIISDGYVQAPDVRVVHDPLENASYPGGCQFINYDDLAATVDELFKAAGFSEEIYQYTQCYSVEDFERDLFAEIEKLKAVWPKQIDANFHQSWTDGWVRNGGKFHWNKSAEDDRDIFVWSLRVECMAGRQITIEGVDDKIFLLKYNSSTCEYMGDAVFFEPMNNSPSRKVVLGSTVRRKLIQIIRSEHVSQMESALRYIESDTDED